MRNFSQKWLLLVVSTLAGVLAVKTGLNAAAPVAGKAEPIEILCSSCMVPGLPQAPHLILRNPKTGALWAYNEDALRSGEAAKMGIARPAYLGTIFSAGARKSDGGTF